MLKSELIYAYSQNCFDIIYLFNQKLFIEAFLPNSVLDIFIICIVYVIYILKCIMKFVLFA